MFETTYVLYDTGCDPGLHICLKSPWTLYLIYDGYRTIELSMSILYWCKYRTGILCVFMTFFFYVCIIRSC